MKRLFLALVCVTPIAVLASGRSQSSPSGDSVESAPDGWHAAAPRDEIKPSFAYEPKGGRSGGASLLIEHDERPGLDGYWTKTFPIEGGRYYRFCAQRRLENVAVPRRSAVARVLW